MWQIPKKWRWHTLEYRKLEELIDIRRKQFEELDKVIKSQFVEYATFKELEVAQ